MYFENMDIILNVTLFFTQNFCIGVTHGEELRSLQHYEMLLPPIVDGVDRIVSDQLISMFYNFVAHG